MCKYVVHIENEHERSTKAVGPVVNVFGADVPHPLTDYHFVK